MKTKKLREDACLHQPQSEVDSEAWSSLAGQVRQAETAQKLSRGTGVSQKLSLS